MVILSAVVFYVGHGDIFTLFVADAPVGVLFVRGVRSRGVNIFKNVLSKHDAYEGYVTNGHELFMCKEVAYL